jgi:hypothetical protein
MYEMAYEAATQFAAVKEKIERHAPREAVKEKDGLPMSSG